MAFWGIEIKSGKPYVHQYDDEKGRLHVSQATVGDSSSKEKAIVMCSVGDKKPVYLCSLLPNRMETCPLNVEFEEYDEVTFSVIGPHSIHLSGFFYGESEDNDCDESDGYDFGSFEDGGFEVGSGSEDYTDYDSGDEKNGYSDDGFDMFPPSPVANSGVKIEEIIDDEAPGNDNGVSSSQKRQSCVRSVSNDADVSQNQIVLKNDTSPLVFESEEEDGVPVFESEDENGFPISVTAKSGASFPSTEEEKGDSSEKVSASKYKSKRKKGKDDSVNLKDSKRRKEDFGREADPARKTSQPVAATIEDVPTVIKKVRKSKKKKVSNTEEKPQEPVSNAKSSILDEENDQKESNGKSFDKNAGTDAEKKLPEDKSAEKNKKKSKQLEGVTVANTKQNVPTKNELAEGNSDQIEAKPFQERSFSNGLVIEELEMDKPDGRRASPGKKVSVQYIGKLKRNGKIFDSNIGRAPFKFRLGVGQVIKGWDVGVNGMRVGDKRRLTIPPAMGYGERGAGAAIPPNSWLVFEVKLVDVN